MIAAGGIPLLDNPPVLGLMTPRSPTPPASFHHSVFLPADGLGWRGEVTGSSPLFAHRLPQDAVLSLFIQPPVSPAAPSGGTGRILPPSPLVSLSRKRRVPFSRLFLDMSHRLSPNVTLLVNSCYRAFVGAGPETRGRSFSTANVYPEQGNLTGLEHGSSMTSFTRLS